MEFVELLEQARSQLVQATGLKPVGVTGAHKDELGWRITLDMLEMARIPPASDVLGDYEVLLDEEGRLLQFERRKTRIRSEPWEKG